MKENFVIIAGTRSFDNYDLLKEKCDFYLSSLDNPVIVTGDCKGADKLGQKYAEEKWYSQVVLPANWKVGKRAGPERNERMAKIAKYLIVFWDGKSKGSKQMISAARSHGLNVKIVEYNKTQQDVI